MQLFANPVTTPPFAGAQAADSGNTTQASPGDSSSDSATITANDFLQLLVTEMQNQDPTSNTDPNEYIDQLVQVNSLEQLVSINQDLGGSSTSSGGSGTGGNTGSVNGPTSATAGSGPAPGNLSATDTGPAASRVATALGTAAHTLAPGSSGSPLDSAISALRSRAHHARTTVSNPSH